MVFNHFHGCKKNFVFLQLLLFVAVDDQNP